MDDLLPRADISGAIAGPVAQLGSANWKERKAALDEIESAIAAAGGRVQANVSAREPTGRGRAADVLCLGTRPRLACIGRRARVDADLRRAGVGNAWARWGPSKGLCGGAGSGRSKDGPAD
jgi:hypothetical protein